MKLQIDTKLSSFLAEYRSKSNLRSVAVRRVSVICSCLSFKNMIVKVLSLVFLFIIHTRFLKGKSITDIFRSRYGEAFVRKNMQI